MQRSTQSLCQSHTCRRWAAVRVPNSNENNKENPSHRNGTSTDRRHTIPTIDSVLYFASHIWCSELAPSSECVAICRSNECVNIKNSRSRWCDCLPFAALIPHIPIQFHFYFSRQNRICGRHWCMVDARAYVSGMAGPGCMFQSDFILFYIFFFRAITKCRRVCKCAEETAAEPKQKITLNAQWICSLPLMLLRVLLHVRRIQKKRRRQQQQHAK